MKTSCTPLALALALALGSVQAPAAAADQAALARLLAAPRLDVAATDSLYRHAVLDSAGVDGLYRQLETLSRSDASADARAMAQVAQGYLHWRQGDGAQALAAAGQALAQAPNVDAHLLQARLLEARGDLAAAAAQYRQALAGSGDAAEQELLRLRLALLDGDDAAAALAALAQQRPQAWRNRAAAVLAVLGQPRQALAQYRPGDAYAQQIRAAGWALAAGADPAAREHAWAAFAHAGNAIDRRYALALLMESYRDQGTLADAVDFLQAQPPQPELQQATVDALLELQRYDAAIALVRGARDPELRQRLLGILELAGRQQEMVAEYRSLIQQQPQRLDGYVGLAAHYMAQGEQDQALAVYRQLFDGNRGRPDVLLPAARQMAAMGLQEQALGLLGQAGATPALATEVKFFLFETLLAQGQDAQAAQVLQELRQLAPPGDQLQVEIADGYERLQQPQQALDVLAALERARPQGLDYDLQVRIAELTFRTGHAEQSLERWRALWAQARLPARRNYLERQIVKVARSLDRLDQLADELEAQQSQGTLQRSGLDLLVALSLAQDDRARAEAALARFTRASGAGPTDELLQLADLYTRLDDMPRLEQTLRRLLQADPDNAGIYLRKLAVSTLRQPMPGADGEPESPQAQAQRVERLLQQLQAGSARADAEDLRFAAGVYAMAGLDGRAIDDYRRALALAPDDADSLLQLADLLKRQRRSGEAVAMLQYVAESAADGKTFALAIDGLIGVLAAEPGRRLRSDDPLPPPAAVLGWAQRRVMERFVRDGDDYALYSLLADLGQAQSDFDLQLRSLDNALALAGDQRPLLLRQLVTLASGSANGDASGPAIGDNARKLIYGRRLIALKREFPPDFYADLGKSLLAGGDRLGAERAFAAMTDIGGLVNVAQVKGDTYAGQGYAEQALLNYGQALARDRGNLELVLKTSILLEQQGQLQAASRWYWQGLRSLVLRQPLQDNGLANDGGLDAQRYFPSLLEGLLLTWPEAPAAQRQILEPLQQLFEQTLAQADPEGPQLLARQVRLNLVLALARRIAESGNDFAQVDGFDAAIAARFADDPAQRAGALYYRRLTGRAEPVATADWVMRGLGVQTGAGDKHGNVGLALAIAAASGDRAQVGALVEAALAAESGWRQAQARDPQADPGPDTLYLLLVQGMNRLPRQMFLEQVLAPLQAAPFREQVLFNLYRGAPDAYAQLERLAGSALLRDDTLIERLAAHGNDPLPYLAERHAAGAADAGGAQALTARFDADQRIALYERLGARAGEGRGRSMLQQTLVRQLLLQPLDRQQQARLLESLGKDMQVLPDGQEPSAAYFLNTLLVLDCAPANRGLLQQAAERLARRYPDGRHLPELLAVYFAGEREQAFAQLQALHADIGERAGNYPAEIAHRFFPEQRQLRIERFLAATAPGDADIAEFYREFVVQAASSADPPDRGTLARYYRKLAALAPDNAAFQAGLLDLLLQERDVAGFNRQLQDYVARNPGQREAATLLVLGYRLQHQPQQALAVEQASGVDADDVAWMVQSLNKASAPRQGAYAPDFGRLLLQVYHDYETAEPEAPVVRAVAAQRRIDAERDEAGRDLRTLAQAYADAPDRAAGVLRGLWRNAMPGERQRLLISRFDLQGRPQVDETGLPPAGVPDLLAAMAALAPVSAEFESWLRALPPEQRQRQQRLYDLLAQGLQAQGRVAERFQQLLGQLSAGGIGGHDLQLLATMAVRTGAQLDDGQRQALVQRLRRMPLLAPEQRTLLAQVFAVAGDNDTAAQLLDAALLQALYPDAAGSPGYDPWMRPEAIVVAIADGLGQWPDREAARRTWSRLLERIDQERAASSVKLPEPAPPAWLRQTR
ncbi:hypothetical protein XaplCFBP3122_06230 [Xanthomonas arboricola pv. populi]|uniref:Cellulose synthase n=1 Tax=Xanthomonas arboricola pv. populi TaxID=487823 RepID=A0A2S6Z7M9_9XANT|nr:hypothetical protein [Xanthomonas arboricola]PPT77551.1 hypothetical protein XaplCFBP3122_06230 [Xanthomonas arboricola pv. populi]